MYTTAAPGGGAALQTGVEDHRDIALAQLLAWVRNLNGFCEARDIAGSNRFVYAQAWLDRGLAHPAVQLEVMAV